MTGIIQKSLWGVKAFIDPDNYLFGRNALATGGRDKPMVVVPGSNETVALFEDFLSKSVSGKGDTGKSVPYDDSPYFQALAADTGRNIKLQQNMSNGVIQLNAATIGGAATTVAASVAAVFGHNASWKANMGKGTDGRLRMGARFKVPGINNESGGKHEGSWNVNGLFIGFTDTGILATVEMPYFDTGEATEATDTGSLHTGTVASDMVGFYYGERSDTGWRGIASTSGGAGTDDSGDQQVLLTSTNPTANTYVVAEVEITHSSSDTGGTATFYLDGQPVGKIKSPVANNKPLVPVVAAIFTDTGAAAVDLDWISVSGFRDTGE